MNNLANVFGLISHFFWRKTDHIILRGSQFLRVGNSQFGDNTLGIGTIAPDAMLHVAGRMRSESGMGWRHTKSCANNTATNIATLTMPTPHLLMTALVTLSVSASGKRAIQSYIVSWVYNKVDVTAMGSPTFIGVTTLTLTAAATTGSKLLTLTALQNSGAAATVEINVQPIAVHAEEVATFAGL